MKGRLDDHLPFCIHGHILEVGFSMSKTPVTRDFSAVELNIKKKNSYKRTAEKSFDTDVQEFSGQKR